MNRTTRETFAKRAGNRRAAERLRHEAEVLGAARHPGVVELIGLEDSGAAAVLLTARVAGSALASRPALAFEEAAGVLAGVASTLADLHDVGIVHGALAPEHVLVTEDGRPVLCGLSSGGRVGQVPPGPPDVPEEFADPARSPADPLLAESDVFGLGALMTWMLRAAPPAKPSRALLKLRAVAARASSSDAERRPSAREAAAAITAAVPGCRLPGSGRAEAAEGPGRGRARPWPGSAGRLGERVAAVVVAGVLTLLGAAYLWKAAGRTESAAPPPTVTGTNLPASPFTGPTTDSPTRADSRPLPSALPPVAASCPPDAGSLSADVDGDGCPEELRWADGVLEGEAVRWAVGRPGDQVATADWRCTGTPTLALLRPATGEVFVFDAWASPGRDVVAAATARIDGGFALRRADLDSDLCPELVVERRGGPPATVTP